MFKAPSNRAARKDKNAMFKAPSNRAVRKDKNAMFQGAFDSRSPQRLPALL